jgi:PHP family Zn ribbon phosphoesterase
LEKDDRGVGAVREIVCSECFWQFSAEEKIDENGICPYCGGFVKEAKR